MDIKEKQVLFGDLRVNIKKLNLSTANKIFPFVLNSMTKISIGEFSFFLDLRPHDIDMLQQVICEYTEVTGKKIRNLELEDIEDNYTKFPSFLGEFLEFNFGFFSEARNVMKLLAIGTPSEIVEETKEKPQNPVADWIFKK